MVLWPWLSGLFKKEGSMDGSLVEPRAYEPAPPLNVSNPTPLESSWIDPKLGKLSRNYEVGPKGTVGTISKGTGDPGGKSYGLWQLASKTGTLKAFVNQSKYKYKLATVPLASAEFDRAWKQIAIDYPDDFEQDQYNFIKKTHFDPVYSLWLSRGMNDHHAIQEVLWSMGVQHGKAKTIVERAITNIKVHVTQSVELHILELYNARRKYVRSFLKGKLLTALLNRYDQEERDAYKLVD
jgi:hypothetical protein